MANPNTITYDPQSPGQAGGDAIRMDFPLTLANSGSVVAGGGGGAGGPPSVDAPGDGGSGGAGWLAGTAGRGGTYSDGTGSRSGLAGQSGTKTAGGAAVGNAFAGGGPAAQGMPTSGAIQGGSAGFAIRRNGYQLLQTGNAPVGAVA